MKRWIEPPSIEVPEDLRSLLDGHPLVGQTLVRRGLTQPDQVKSFLDPHYYTPSPPSELSDLEHAANRLSKAIRDGETICVWGDFDVDGQTATTLLVSGLKSLGAKVTYHIPVRETESHGINLPVLKQVLANETDLLLTCDTGVDAHEATDYAQEQGVDVIITDHHKLPPELPRALAVVNPQRLTSEHPLRGLPGVGVAYKLMEQLYEMEGRFTEVDTFLDLVALGIVADVAEVTLDNRYLLQRGLSALRSTERLGLLQLMSNLELEPSQVTEEHIGFMLAPRLNALGRLSDANPIVEFLTTKDETFASTFASQLEVLNARRKLMCDQVMEAALAQIKRDPDLLEYGALVLAHESWPAGVVGIVASRLAEQYNRPTLLLSTPPDQTARGSARSIPSCDITQAISSNAELLESFGGHTMAAGLAIKTENIPGFRHALGQTVDAMLVDQPPEGELPIDAFLPLSDISLDMVDDLDQLAPFGPGNPPIVLATRNINLISCSSLGKNEDHLQLQVEDEHGTAQRVIWWQGAGMPLPQGNFDLAYTARINQFRGERRLQVEWIDFRITDTSSPDIHTDRPEIVDYRHTTNCVAKLNEILSYKSVQLWAEGKSPPLGSKKRHELGPAEELVIWSIPPSPDVLRQALERVSSRRVYLFGNNPELDQPRIFLKHLAGLAKYAIVEYSGKTSIEELAAASAHSEATVRKGLTWLVAQGLISAKEETNGSLLLKKDSQPDKELSENLLNDIQDLLRESAAYRSHYLNADMETLL